MKCNCCGQEHPDNFQFCPVTGKKIKVQQEALKACANHKCPDFDKYILPLDSRFCPTCGFWLEEDYNNIIVNNNDIMPQQKLKEIRDKFDSLKKFTESSSVDSSLAFSRSLQTQIISDQNVTSLCRSDRDLASLRSQLLDDIKSYQKELIQRIAKKDDTVTRNEGLSITSLDEAKRRLAELADEELGNEAFKSYPAEFATHFETLRRVSDECKTGKYTALFMGEYQSGKTTTLNAICGGKNVGSIGDGNATTAVPVAVSYGKTWNVTVGWKTPTILCNILYHLSHEFEDFDRNKFDIEDPQQRNRWLNKIENLRKDRRSCPRVGEEELKYLVLSAIILKYYASESLKETAKQVFSYSDIPQLTKFPKGMETRWYNEGVGAFDIEESLFSFIEQVDCTCPSENLRQLNCTIIDCPGLFSNDYDTEITEKAMREAHAIIYFLPYHKGIGQDVCGSLYRIQKDYTDFHRKLFVINNSSVVGNTDFIESNSEKIKQMFGSEKELYAYDAKLAYLAAIKQTYDNNGLTDSEIEGFCKPVTKNDILGNKKVVEFKSFDEKWSYLTKQYVFHISEWAEKANPTVTELFEYSSLQNVLKELKLFIESNEAYAMILSNGIYKLSDELKQIRDSLYVTNVEPYLLEGAKCREKWNQRLDNAERFNRQKKEIINRHFFEKQNGTVALCDTLTAHAYKNLFPTSFYEGIAREIACIVYDKKNMLLSAHFDKQEFSNMLEPLIKDALLRKLKGKFEFWNQQLKSGQDGTFSTYFMSESKAIELELVTLWNNIFGADSDCPINNYVTFPKSTKDFYLMIHNTNGADANANVLGLSGAILVEITTVITGVAALIASVVFMVVAFYASNPLGWVVGAVTAAGAGVAILCKGKEAIREFFIDKLLSPKIYSELKNADFEGSVRKGLNGEIREQLEIYQYRLQCDIQKMKDERDTALTTPADQKEAKCFAAVGCMSRIDDQLNIYKDFVNENVQLFR